MADSHPSQTLELGALMSSESWEFAFPELQSSAGQNVAASMNADDIPLLEDSFERQIDTTRDLFPEDKKRKRKRDDSPSRAIPNAPI